MVLAVVQLHDFAANDWLQSTIVIREIWELDLCHAANRGPGWRHRQQRHWPQRHLQQADRCEGPEAAADSLAGKEVLYFYIAGTEETVDGGPRDPSAGGAGGTSGTRTGGAGGAGGPGGHRCHRTWFVAMLRTWTQRVAKRAAWKRIMVRPAKGRAGRRAGRWALRGMQ